MKAGEILILLVPKQGVEDICLRNTIIVYRTIKERAGSVLCFEALGFIFQEGTEKMQALIICFFRGAIVIERP